MGTRDSATYYFDAQREWADERIRSGIEAYRKGDAHIVILGADRKPVSGAKVEIRQLTHEFKYGANIFMLDEFESEEKNRIYREQFSQYCNLATVPFYWSDLEPTQGQPRFAKNSPRIYRRPPIDLCLEYCFANGVEPKCHCLNYDVWAPTWAIGDSSEVYKEKLEHRFRELAERYGRVIPSWEVTNETFTFFTTDPSHVFYNAEDFVEWSFATAEKYFSGNHLIINDYEIWDPNSYRGTRSQYFMQIRHLLEHGAHLDSIGMQFHSFFPQAEEGKMAEWRYNPYHLFRVLDTYAALGRKMQITEMTIPAYSDKSEDEEMQARLLRETYRTFFSHPAMEAVIYWNFVDGYAAFAPQGDMTAGENVYYGGLFRFDLTEKPAARELRRLFREEWHTEARREGKGYIHSFRGFYGDYEVTVEANGTKKTERVTFASGEPNHIVITMDK